MKPQNYSARTAYRPPAAWYRRLNWLGVLLTSLGLAPRDAVTLQVRGRTSGKVRRVPILRTRYRGDDYLVALAGESQWVRNVRAARGHAVIRRGRSQPVRLDELAPTERPEIIAEYLRAGRHRSGVKANADQARFYFGLSPDPSLDDIRTVVDNYPVFRISYSGHKAPTQRESRRQAPGESGRVPRLQPRWFIVLFWKVHRVLVRQSGGRLGLWRPSDKTWGALRLTTVGRHSHQERSVIVGYYEDGPNLVTMAMNGWGEAEPAWWLNLQEHPTARVQLANGTRQVIAHAATGAERDRLWDRWRSLDKDLDGYARRRPSETAVVVLEPVT